MDKFHYESVSYHETHPKLGFTHKEIERFFINNETIYFCNDFKIISASMNVFIVKFKTILSATQYLKAMRCSVISVTSFLSCCSLKSTSRGILTVKSALCKQVFKEFYSSSLNWTKSDINQAKYWRFGRNLLSVGLYIF